MKKRNDRTELYIRDLFALNLKNLRLNRNMSQLELSGITGLSPSYINELENQRKWPSVETMAKFANAFNLEPFRFFLPLSKMGIKKVDIIKEEMTDSITHIISNNLDKYAEN